MKEFTETHLIVTHLFLPIPVYMGVSILIKEGRQASFIRR